MKEIAVFICNYNKKDYLLRNIESLSKQSILEQADVYVIDNASTDGAPDAVEQCFPWVHVIRNKENVGGAGGFAQALAMGNQQEYPYIVLADNDIEWESTVLEELHEYLKSHGDVGMVGPKLLRMDRPDRVWIFGQTIDFDSYKVIDGYFDQPDDDVQEDEIFCDNIPACCLMIKRACLKQTGYMPADNFIAWDDVEWCHRFGLAGYKVAVIKKVKVWHMTGARVIQNYFFTYYQNRNKMHFFANYISEDSIEKYAESALGELFAKIYGYAHKGKYNAITTLMYALQDFLNNVRGRAEEHKILPVEDIAGCERSNRETVLVSHVKDITDYDETKLYEDSWGNVIATKEEFYYFQNYNLARRNFIMMYKQLFIDAIKRIRE